MPPATGRPSTRPHRILLMGLLLMARWKRAAVLLLQEVVQPCPQKNMKRQKRKSTRTLVLMMPRQRQVRTKMLELRTRLAMRQHQQRPR